MCLYKILLKTILQWATVKRVDLIFRIVCQISGQDNVNYKILKSFWHFQIKSLVPIIVEYRFCYYNRSKDFLFSRLDLIGHNCRTREPEEKSHADWKNSHIAEQNMKREKKKIKVSASSLLIGAKGYCQNICFNKGFVCNRDFNS